MPQDVLRVKRRLSLAAVAAAVGVLGFSPGAQAEVRVGENYRLNSDPNAFRAKDQVALAINPDNAQHIVEVNEDKLEQQCEGTRSLDGGATWSEAVPLPFPTSNPPFGGNCNAFQTIEFGNGQNVYATSANARTGQANSMLVFKSRDGGLTWDPGVVAMEGGTTAPSPTAGPTAGPSFLQPVLTVDRGAGTNGADRVYAVARDLTGAANRGRTPACRTAGTRTTCQAVMMAVSNDGGQSFSSPVVVSQPGVSTIEVTQPVLNADSVSVAWRTLGTVPNPDPAAAGTTPFVDVPQGELQIARSTDRGQTFGAPVSITGVTGKGTLSSTHTVRLPFNGSSHPRLAADRRNDNLYIVYNQAGDPGPSAPPGGYQGADHFIAPDAHVYFQRSRNGGFVVAADEDQRRDELPRYSDRPDPSPRRGRRPERARGHRLA